MITSVLVVCKLEACVYERILYLIDVIEVSCFKKDPQIAAVDVRTLACTFVVDRNNVAALFCDDVGNALELTWLVDKLDTELSRSARCEKTSLDNL